MLLVRDRYPSRVYQPTCDGHLQVHGHCTLGLWPVERGTNMICVVSRYYCPPDSSEDGVFHLHVQSPLVPPSPLLLPHCEPVSSFVHLFRSSLPTSHCNSFPKLALPVSLHFSCFFPSIGTSIGKTHETPVDRTSGPQYKNTRMGDRVGSTRDILEEENWLGVLVLCSLVRPTLGVRSLECFRRTCCFIVPARLSPVFVLARRQLPLWRSYSAVEQEANIHTLLTDVATNHLHSTRMQGFRGALDGW